MDLKDIKGTTSTQGLESGQASPINNNQPKKVGWALGLGILFMPCIFSWFTLRKGYSIGARVVSVLWAFIIIGSMSKDNNVSRNTASVREEKNETRVQYTSESCNQLSHTFGASSQLSDIQKEELWKEFHNKGFDWDLVVTEVSSRSFGSGYQVQYKCEGSNSFIQDIIVYYPESARGLVLGLRKNKIYRVTGKLSNYNTILGLTADAI